MHGAIIGTTTSGKTYLARQFASEFMESESFKSVRHKVMALHKAREPWKLKDEVSWQTHDIEEFLAEIEVQAWYNNKHGASTAAFMEMSDASVAKYDERCRKLFREKRHDGFRFFYLTQRAATVHPDIRENCTSLCLFTCGGKGAQLWADEFVDDGILKAANLPAHYFVHKQSRYAPARVRILTIPDEK